MWRNSKGLSIVEALVGLAIVSGVITALMQFNEYTSRIQARANFNSLFDTRAGLIRLSLASASVCLQNLGGKAVNPALPLAITTLTGAGLAASATPPVLFRANTTDERMQFQTASLT